MNQLRISGKPKDWTNWEKLIEDCSTYDELTNIARGALSQIKPEKKRFEKHLGAD